MKSFMIILIILILWVVFAQSCMTFRKADDEMKLIFQRRGVQLKTATEKIEGRNIHYAQTGKEDLPTLVFVHGTPGSWNAFSDYMIDKELLRAFRMVSIDRPGFGYSDVCPCFEARNNSTFFIPQQAYYF